MNKSNSPYCLDPEYVQGQIFATQALVLGLANLLVTNEAFRAQSLQRLELLKVALLSQPVSDARLKAVEDCEKWVKNQTT